VNPKTESRYLCEILKIVNAPENAGRRFTAYAKRGMIIAVLLLFVLLSGHVSFMVYPVAFTACAFASGVAFGLAIWFLQAGTQTAVLVRHLSAESIQARIAEIQGE
jgi:hypothetical protein